MALRAKYEADFTDFYGAVAQATTSLDTWENKGAAVEKQMDGIANSLSDAPVEGAIQNVTTGVENLGDQAGALEGIFTNFAAGMVAAFSVQAIGQFAIGVVQAGAEIGDLSVKLGISTEAVQRFKYAAEQSGTTIDNVGRSIQTMNDKLGGGSDSTRAAVAALGLDFQALRESSPEDAFVAIGDALGGLNDPMERTRLEMDLFGKSGVENSQLFVDGIRKVGAETKVMSDDTIKSLKAAEDAWARLYNAVTVASGGVIAKAFQIGDTYATVFKAMLNPQDKDAVQAMNEALLNMTGNLEQATEKVPEFALRAPGLKPVALAFDEVAGTIKEMNKQLGIVGITGGLVEPKLGTLANYTRSVAKETESLKDYFYLATEATGAFNTGLRFTSEVIESLPPQLAAVTESVDAMSDAMTNMSELGPAGGGGTINTAGITIPDQEELWRRYTAAYAAISAASGVRWSAAGKMSCRMGCGLAWRHGRGKTSGRPVS